MKSPVRSVLLMLLTILPAAFTGCKTTDQTAGTKGEDEYVYVTVTGSNIPKRIKKSDIAAGKVPKDEQMQVIDKEDFARGMHPTPMKGN